MGTGTSADSGAEPGIPADGDTETGTLADGGAEPGIPANGGTGIVPPAGGGLGLDLPPFSGGYYLLGRAGAGMPKKEGTGKSGFTEFRPPQPPGCNPQMIAKGNPMWEGRKKQKFCHFRGHAPGK